MEHLGTLLATLPLPDDDSATASGSASAARDPTVEDAATRRLLTDLGADLPAGHLHVWGGPSGAGKTSFLLSLLHGAAARARPVVYATYDLPASTLAMRLLAMLAQVHVGALPDPGGRSGSGHLDHGHLDHGHLDHGHLDPGGLDRVLRVRRALADMPFYLLSARGFGVPSLADRIARAPCRPQVLVVDYVQAVIRERGKEIGEALRELSALAVRQHVAVVGVFRADTAVSGDARDAVASMERAGADLVEPGVSQVAARVGWITPVEPSLETSAGDAGVRRAELLSNRYGERASMPIQIDPTSGRVEPVADDPTSPSA